MRLVAAVDDIATERVLSEGWAYFVLPTDVRAEFGDSIRQLLSRHKLKQFHAKEFRKRDEEAFRAFLKTIRATVEAHLPSSMISVSFMDPTWKRDFVGFAERIAYNGLEGAGVQEHDFRSAIASVAPCLFSMQRLTTGLGDSGSTVLEILLDKGSANELLPNLSVHVDGKPLTGERALRVIYNAYGNRQFPDSPSLVKDGITVLPAVREPMIQVADVVGNFALNQLYKELGVATTIRETKANLFLEVFGDTLEACPYRQLISIENGELRIRDPGCFTLGIRADDVP